MATEPIVETAHGRLRGRRTTGGIEFLGIRYATSSRFAAPTTTDPWPGVADALAPGPAPPQPDRPVARFTHGAIGARSEDCLYLNVHTPALGGSRPVLVWVHGGGFTIGHGAAGIYRGDRLASAADAVVVTINYRLGSLGWLAHPQLSTAPGAPSANWALLDQLAALEWAQENIGAFGGDAGRVTLAGQSAGALSAMDLLEVTRGRLPFARVILQSPPLVDVAHPPEQGAAWAEMLSARAGGDGFDAAQLRSLPAQRIVALHEELLDEPAYRGTRGGALPTIDPALLPVSPRTEPGAAPTVDVLIGSTSEEGTFFFASPWRPPPPPDRVPEIVSHLPGVTDAGELLERYHAAALEAGRPAEAQALLVQIATDTMFTGPVREWARARASDVAPQGGRVYRYRVDHPGGEGGLGATHTVEVPLLFGTWEDGDAGQRLGGASALAATVAARIQASWAGFIHGDGPGWGPVCADATAGLGVFGGADALAVSADALVELAG